MKRVIPEDCPACWGSHCCDLRSGHSGDHLCLLPARQPSYPVWIWQDTGGWCNFWDGKQIGFLYDVCAAASAALLL